MPSGGVTPAGGSQPVTARELLSGNAVTIDNNSSALLPWGRDSGSTLLDLADTTQPVIVTAGVYIVAVTVSVRFTGPMSAGGYFEAELDLDANGDTAKVYTRADATATNILPEQSLTVASYMDAGAVVDVFVQNFDGVQAVGFFLRRAIVQQVQ